jgi:hypothetical protein
MKRLIRYKPAAAVANALIALIAAAGLSGCLESGSEAGKAPIISDLPAASEVMAGQPFVLTPYASDPEGDALTFAIARKPSWASFDTSTGILSGTPAPDDVGVYANIQISASDGARETLSNLFSVTVKAAPAMPTQEQTPAPGNQTPTISGNPPQRAAEGQAYSFVPAASDPDNDSLTFSISNKPFWATFSPETGALSGTLAVGAAGAFLNIVISVSDGNASVSLPAFTIVVDPANRAPYIAGSPPTAVREGVAYLFRPAASDADGNALTFTVSGRPAWASFNTSNGELAGTPPIGSAGSFANIVISVSDGVASASLPAFGITVQSSNRAPTIAGTAPSGIVEGQAYSFVPAASDPDRDPLSFSIVNRPAWATFSTSTGALTGTPGAGTVGTYSGIRITVTDGNLSASLPAFSIDVRQTATGTATLRWSPPTTRTDGTALTDLAGYRIHYGTSQGSYPNRITINNPGITTYVVENLAPATYYFVTTAFDATGGESDHSAVASKTIQ